VAEYLSVRLMIPIPAHKRSIVGLYKNGFQGATYDVTIAKEHIPSTAMSIGGLPRILGMSACEYDPSIETVSDSKHV